MKNPYNAVLSQALFICGFGPAALGLAKHWSRTLTGRWLLGLERWIMAVKIDTLETVPPHVAIAAGLGGKAIILINGEFRAETMSAV